MQNQAQNKQVERSWGKACSRDLQELKTNTNKDDHRAFKRWRPSLEDGQKWGVYSCPSLTELESQEVTGVNVKAQRRPIFDKAEDLDKHAR